MIGHAAASHRTGILESRSIVGGSKHVFGNSRRVAGFNLHHPAARSLRARHLGDGGYVTFYLFLLPRLAQFPILDQEALVAVILPVSKPLHLGADAERLVEEHPWLDCRLLVLRAYFGLPREAELAVLLVADAWRRVAAVGCGRECVEVYGLAVAAWVCEVDVDGQQRGRG